MLRLVLRAVRLSEMKTVVCSGSMYLDHRQQETPSTSLLTRAASKPRSAPEQPHF